MSKIAVTIPTHESPNHITGGIEGVAKLIPGKSAAAVAVVTAGSTAKAVGSGSLDVFATPMMVALMEQAACNCLADCLEDGQTSVGTDISVAHTAASPIGAEVTATAAIVLVNGRNVVFEVTASDRAGEIGKGRHTRAIVDAERFTRKTLTREV